MNKFHFAFLISILAFACKPNPVSEVVDPVPNTDIDFVVETIIPTGEEAYLENNSDYIFDQEKLHTFELNLLPESLEEINEDPTAEEYVEATLSFEGDTISPVGIRYKGSIGAFVNCVSGTDWTNPSGSKTCTKLSMKIKVNWEGREERFYGLKKIQLHSMNNDKSQLRERLGYWLFREMGVPTARATHARLVINGEYVGLFALVEQIDGRFTRYNYEDGKGNLYKEIWPLTSDGVPFPTQTYLNNLVTNEDENPTADLIGGFAQEIFTASSENLQNVISNRMDINEIISYVVVDRTIRNDDGAFHWYCNGGNCSPHNFYWYEEPNEGKLHLIPWDLDHAFENIIGNFNPVTSVADDWGEITADCAPYPFGLFGIRQRSAACDKLIGGWASFETEYETRLAEFKEGPFSEENINLVLDTWVEQIRDATMEARGLHDDAITVGEWENAVDALRAQVVFAREN